MKKATCDHDYNPPSRCPSCRSEKRRRRKAASLKGWATRRNQHLQAAEAPTGSPQDDGGEKSDDPG